MKSATQKVNRAISAAVATVGAKAHIEDLPGSEPLNEDANLREVALEVFEELAGKNGYSYNEKWMASSTDMGDISTLFPSIHMYTNGAIGNSHGIDYLIEDPYTACVMGAKAEVGLICKLLSNGAEKAKKIISEFKPVFASVEEYLAHKHSLSLDKDTVIYNEDGTVTLDYKN